MTPLAGRVNCGRRHIKLLNIVTIILLLCTSAADATVDGSNAAACHQSVDVEIVTKQSEIVSVEVF